MPTPPQTDLMGTPEGEGSELVFLKSSLHDSDAQAVVQTASSMKLMLSCLSRSLSVRFLCSI